MKKDLNKTEAVVPGADAADKKYLAFLEFLKERNIQGFQLVEPDDNNKIFRTNLMVEGQTLPTFVVVNNTVYSYIQIHLVTVTPEKAAKCLEFLNTLNERLSMLKYFIGNTGNLIVHCSIPAADDKFDPALIIALLDQVKQYLEADYADIMKTVWEK